MSADFQPIDGDARSGAFALLKDSAGTCHVGRWCARANGFTYSSGRPIASTVTHYDAAKSTALACPRQPGSLRAVS